MSGSQQALLMASSGGGGSGFVSLTGGWSSSDTTAHWTTSLSDVRATYSGSGTGSIRATNGTGTNGIVYWAVEIISLTGIGYIGLTTASQAIGSIGSPYFLVRTSDGSILKSGLATAAGNNVTAPTVGSILMFAVDMVALKVWVGTGGSWTINAGALVGDPTAGTNPSATFTGAEDWKPLLQSVSDAQAHDLLVGGAYPYSPP